MSEASRYRKIHCLIWNDDKFPYMSDEGKLVFFLLLTTPFSTPFGCYKAGKASLLEESRMDQKGFTKGFEEGLNEGMFKYDERTLTVFLPNFLKHNKPANPNVVIKWGKVFTEIPEGPLKLEIYHAISDCCKGLGKGFEEGFAKGFGEPPRNSMPIQEQEQEQEQNNKTLSEQEQEKNQEQSPPAETTGFIPSGNIYAEIALNDIKETCKSLSQKLKEVVTLRRKQNVTPQRLGSWASSIRMMHEKDKVPLEEIEAGIEWYRQHWNDSKFIPVIESASSLREKWGKLVEAARRTHRGPGGNDKAEENDLTKLSHILMENKRSKRHGTTAINT